MDTVANLPGKMHLEKARQRLLDRERGGLRRDADLQRKASVDAQALRRFPLDIVQLEKIAPEYADDIRQHGKMVYERE